jgi:hypothetical protein
MLRVEKVIVRAKLKVNVWWILDRFDVYNDGVEVPCGAATDDVFPSSQAARAWFDKAPALQFLRERGVDTVFEKVRP